MIRLSTSFPLFPAIASGATHLTTLFPVGSDGSEEEEVPAGQDHLREAGDRTGGGETPGLWSESGGVLLMVDQLESNKSEIDRNPFHISDTASGEELSDNR